MHILYEDESIIVIDKPNKMMVYPTSMARNCTWFATVELEKLGYKKLHTVHRLDRPTSGILLFAKTKESASAFSLMFRNKEVIKTYLCLVRGHFEEEKGSIDKELKKDGDGVLQDAKTEYNTIEKVIADLEVSKYPKTRLSLLSVVPITGRMHQIRRHFNHKRHPIIGDKRYGDRHYNRYLKEKIEIEDIMLHAFRLEFTHPITKEEIKIQANLPDPFRKTLAYFGFST